MRRVKIISTGGTIANTVDGRVTIDQVLDRLEQDYPGEHPRMYANLEVEEVLRRGAETIVPAD
ncbi:MAG: hypothetical protein GEU79_11770 [Acidimicrobiia bacterium]|nr:hypothetical protein [Acidimicrobiia bacterium]